jgi:hypothetical protein
LQIWDCGFKKRLLRFARNDGGQKTDDGGAEVTPDLYVFYLKGVTVSGFYFVSNDFAVTFIGQMLEAHKAAGMSSNILISGFYSILFAREVRIHRLEEIRVVRG